jgi:tRNA (cytosine49-C5)-methyltransferase
VSGIIAQQRSGYLLKEVVMPSSRHEMFAAYADFIPAFPAFCAALQTTPLCCLRVNTLRTTPETVQSLLAQQGYQVTPSPLASELLLVNNLTHPGSLREALWGYYHPQAFTSALAALILAPQPGERICDLCAAPGSKTSHIAQIMHEQGVIIANDRHIQRLAMLEYNLKRLGITNVVLTCYAGQNFPLRCKFDRVLVDAPCSGEGNYRWNAQGRLLHYRQAEGDMPRLQKQLLLRGFDLLVEGGTLLYATCTYNPAENEAVVQHLLEQRPATLQPIRLTAPHCPGLQQWRDHIYDASMERCWRLYPHHINSVGFFLACLRA